jgi:hypothetical protein
MKLIFLNGWTGQAIPAKITVRQVQGSMFLIYFFVGVGLVITLAMGALYFNNARRMTSITAGRIVRSEEREVLRKDTREFETDIVASYTAAGRQYEISRTLPGRLGKRFAQGAPINIRYNPAEPGMADLMPR